MGKKAKTASWAFLLVAGAAVSGFCVEPTLEQAKQDSGVRFSEMTAPKAGAESSPVWAGGVGGKKGVAFTKLDAEKKAGEVPSPEAPAKKPRSRDSFGTKLLTAAGVGAGVGATIGLAVAAPGVLAVMGLAGAVASGVRGYEGGARGWKLAKDVAKGAGLGVGALVIAGGWVGRTVGRGFESLFRRS